MELQDEGTERAIDIANAASRRRRTKGRMFKLETLEQWEDWRVKIDGQHIGHVFKDTEGYSAFVKTAEDENADVSGDPWKTPAEAARAVAEAWLAQQHCERQAEDRTKRPAGTPVVFLIPEKGGA